MLASESVRKLTSFWKDEFEGVPTTRKNVLDAEGDAEGLLCIDAFGFGLHLSFRLEILDYNRDRFRFRHRH